MKHSAMSPKPGKPGTPPRARAKPARGPNRKTGWEKRFCEALCACPDVTAACTSAGVGTSTVYRRREDTPEFKQRWDDALRDGLESAKGELFLRGVTGWQEPVYQGGKMVGTILKKSDNCLIFLLKTHAPETYGDRSKIQHSGSLRSMTPEEEIEAGTSFLEGVTATIRKAAMAGIPNLSGVLAHR